MRAFFAVDLPDNLAPALAEAQAAFDDAPGLTFVDPQQAHVTLKFLGDIPETDDAGSDGPSIDRIITAGDRAIADAAVGPFDCSVEGFGVFPTLDYISVVWAGIGAGAAHLTTLHDALEAETTALGVDAESHEFTPHVTLARMSDARGKAAVRRVVREQDPDIGRFEVETVRLVSSTLTSDGPVYDTVATFDL